jgi:CDP-diglyceride synthetase
MSIGRRLKSGVLSIATNLWEGFGGGKFGLDSQGSWRGRVFTTAYFIFALIACLHFKNIYLLFVMGICIHTANVLALALEHRQGDGFSGKIIRTLLSYPYLVGPGFSLIYIARLEKSNDIFLWIFLTIVSIKISIYLFENIYGGGLLLKKLHPTKTIMSFFGTLIVGIMIGLLASLFLRQRFGRFTMINLVIVLLIHLQDFLNYWLKSHYFDQREDLMVNGYNNLALVVSFVSAMIAIRAIRL